ncbi:hypothetical protein FAGAP_1677 [Fusarium agapanthi]|uniref:Uncharacterized protein n=1 Tax=Fusarium agapanthi TaxID=1803897 RepID=A0A9P5BH14_9HYPO|nr:hypothetical protein FAGAP_1677 [Fusarium agapanthi]
MKSTTTILLLQSIIACAGFTMPEKLPNGVYSVHVNDQGPEVYEGLTVDHSTTVTPQASKSQVEAPVDMLKAQFRDADGGVGEVTQAWYSIWGDVVAFCCTEGLYPMTTTNYAGLLERITDRCGWYVPGTLVPSSLGLYTIGCGYMNYSPGLDFCGASDTGRFMGDKGRC